MIHKILAPALAAAVAATAGTGAAAAPDKLALVHPFSKALIYTQSCIKMVGKIDKAGGSALQVKVRGGPEAIKTMQQAPAVRDGVVDLSCVPAAFYAASIPENEAISTSNASPAYVRANGGMAIIDQLHQKHYKAKYLGWIDSGVGFHIFTAKKPDFKASGLPSFDRTKLRDNPIYGAFFRALGATTHGMSFSEVYSALEKGTINASAWTALGLKQLKWDKFLRNRIDPGFYQTDIGVIINLKSWNKLSAKSKKTLQSTIIAYENESRTARSAESKAEQKLLI